MIGLFLATLLCLASPDASRSMDDQQLVIDQTHALADRIDTTVEAMIEAGLLAADTAALGRVAVVLEGVRTREMIRAQQLLAEARQADGSARERLLREAGIEQARASEILRSLLTRLASMNAMEEAQRELAEAASEQRRLRDELRDLAEHNQSPDPRRSAEQARRLAEQQRRLERVNEKLQSAAQDPAARDLASRLAKSDVENAIEDARAQAEAGDVASAAGHAERAAELLDALVGESGEMTASEPTDADEPSPDAASEALDEAIQAHERASERVRAQEPGDEPIDQAVEQALAEQSAQAASEALARQSQEAAARLVDEARSAMQQAMQALADGDREAATGEQQIASDALSRAKATLGEASAQRTKPEAGEAGEPVASSSGDPSDDLRGIDGTVATGAVRGPLMRVELPERQREVLRQSQRRAYPIEYADLIEQYLRNLGEAPTEPRP
jgi:hypothetical protein